MFGLIPASGHATRFNSIPKFALPYNKSGESLLGCHVRKMKKYCEKVVVSTTSVWKDLLISFDLDIEIMIIEPSTMNNALLGMANQFVAEEYLIGMADTYYEGQNPYSQLSAMLIENSITIACWRIDQELKGRVGQVKLINNRILDVIDKVESCDYPHMWGAIGYKRKNLLSIDKDNSHLGIDLLNQLKNNKDDHYAFEVQGEYFDVGNLAGFKKLLQKTDFGE